MYRNELVSTDIKDILSGILTRHQSETEIPEMPSALVYSIRETTLYFLSDLVTHYFLASDCSLPFYNLEERSKELIGEGHRFFDMLRNGKTIVRKGGYHLPGIVEEIDWDYYKCVLPIPTDQFTFSPDMEQNPGYTKN